MTFFPNMTEEAGILVVDPRRGHLVKFSSRNIERCLGYSADEKRTSIYSLLDDFDPEQPCTDPANALLERTYFLRCRDGRCYEVEASVVFHYDREDRLDYYFVILDIGNVASILGESIDA